MTTGRRSGEEQNKGNLSWEDSYVLAFLLQKEE